MSEAKTILAELKKSLEAIRDATELEAQNLYYERIKSGLIELRQLAKGQPGENYIREKISDLEWNTSALASLHDGNQHTKFQHCVWAIGALNTLSGLDIGKHRDDSH